MAEDEGFEPSVGCPTHAFQACALGRYANPPVKLLTLFLMAKSIGGINYDLPLDPPCGTLVPNSPRAGMQQG
jgi:hypothetical protein